MAIKKHDLYSSLRASCNELTLLVGQISQAMTQEPLMDKMGLI